MDTSRTPEDCHLSSRPIAAIANQLAPPYRVKAHSHAASQLIHALSGVMTVRTPEGSWVVPVGRALWVPQHMEHEIDIAGAVSMRTIFVKGALRRGLAEHCELIEVSPLLREAIVAAVSVPLEYELGGRDERIMQLILDELEAARRLKMHVPVPREPRLARLCEAMIADPARPATLESLALEANMSGRTLARLFLKHVGMTVGEWRRRMRLLLSLPRLAAGASILEVSLEHGYDSPSAFSAMFKRTFGVSPSNYLANGPRSSA
jgi:AraC-like DNA-binding protein